MLMDRRVADRADMQQVRERLSAALRPTQPMMQLGGAAEAVGACEHLALAARPDRDQRPGTLKVPGAAAATLPDPGDRRPLHGAAFGR